MFIYIKISNNLQFLVLATVYVHLATVYYLLQKRAPTVNQIVQNGCLQFISFLGRYFTPESLIAKSFPWTLWSASIVPLEMLTSAKDSA